MNKTTAHIIVGLADIAAVASCYYAFIEWMSVTQAINTESESISVQSYFGLYILIILVPIIHITSLIQWNSFTTKLINGSLIILFLLMLFGVILLDSHINNKLKNAGFHYCDKQSVMMTFSEFRTYLKENIPCID